MLSFFPRDVLGEILDLIESVSEGFSTYFCMGKVITIYFWKLLQPEIIELVDAFN